MVLLVDIGRLRAHGAGVSRETIRYLYGIYPK